jgi:diacylglycerol kinase family enzyme
MQKVIRHVAVVINCKAGALLSCDNPEESWKVAFIRAGLEPSFIGMTTDSLPERLAQAAKSKPDAVVVAGGDGTVACAASTLMGGEIPLAILPCGTMNLLAKDLSLPINDRDAAIKVVTSGHLRNVDVGDVNGHIFLCASMLGLPARLGQTRERGRGSVCRTWVRIAHATWRQLLRTRRLHVSLLADGRAIPARAAALTISINPVDHASGRSLGRTELNGGQFGLYLVDAFSLDVLLSLVLRVLFGRRSASMREYFVNEIDITTRKQAIRVMNDGELRLLIPPLHYRVRRGALRVLVPE